MNTYLETHMPRETGIPTDFPLKCYRPAANDIPPCPEILVGMDSGVSNTAFSCIELIRDKNTNAITDFRYAGAYYFKEELDRFTCQMDRQIYLAKQYFDLFSHRRVHSLTYELLALTSIKNEETLKGVIQAQATTNLINTVAYQLNHPFRPVPATAIKYCLTQNGKATKNDMCIGAYTCTGDEELLHNDHMADAFACCFYAFIRVLKESCACYQLPIPQKFAHMDWNFKTMPKSPWK